MSNPFPFLKTYLRTGGRAAAALSVGVFSKRGRGQIHRLWNSLRAP